jgi:superfamily I DNA and/or RNA helicase
VTDPLLRHIHLTNCRLSLFERLLRQYRDNPDVVQMLTRQGRMHHDIAEFPSKAFYKGQLKEVPLPHQHVVLPPPTSCDDEIESILRTRRVFFIAISPTGEHVSDKVNTSEARAIAAYVVKIYQLTKSTFDPLQTVGVIVPYRNQIAEVRNCIQSYGVPALRDITIDTVERYQGSQRDYIIYGFTIQKYYQLEFLTSQSFVEEGSIIDRKLNVAMTRAREHLIMIGNPALLSRNYVFRQLIAYTKAKGCYC